MSIDEGTLTKEELRKLNSLRKSVGDKLGEEVVGKAERQDLASLRCDRVITYFRTSGYLSAEQLVTLGEIARRSEQKSAERS